MFHVEQFSMSIVSMESTGWLGAGWGWLWTGGAVCCGGAGAMPCARVPGLFWVAYQQALHWVSATYLFSIANC